MYIPELALPSHLGSSVVEIGFHHLLALLMDFRSCIPRLVQLDFRFDSSCLLFKFADFIFLHVGASGIGNDTIEGLSLAVAVWGMLATNL